MMSASPLAYAPVQVKYQKKGHQSPTNPRTAKVTVTPGRIEIASTENKFPTFHIKTCDVVKKPALPKSGSATWLSIDCIQNFDAKYLWVNFQVSSKDTPDLLHVLLHAWSGASSGRPSAVFNDDADEIAAPVHSRPRNATTLPTTAGAPPARSTRRTVEVDPEGSAAAHASFKSDFDAANKTASSNQPNKTAKQLQGMFSEYGIGSGKASEAAAPEPVHKEPKKTANCLPKSLKEPTALGRPAPGPKESYATLARRSNEKYSPVDNQVGYRGQKYDGRPQENVQRSGGEGITDKTFYGKPCLATKTTPLSGARSGTKDSLDVARGLRERSKYGNVKVTKGIRDEVELRDEDTGNNDDYDENAQPSRGKSLTSAAAAAKFDQTVRRQNSGPSTSSSSSALLSTTANGYPLNNPSKKPSMMAGITTRTTSNRQQERTSAWEPSYLPWAYKSQQNIGNSCYMNAMMQVLAVCPIFVRQLHMATKSLEKSSETIRLFNGLMSWLSGSKGSRGPVGRDYLEMMRNRLMGLDVVFEEMGGFAQQDAEEALTALLGAVSDECTGKGFKKRDSLTRRASLGSPTKAAPPIKAVEEEAGSAPSVDAAAAAGAEPQRRRSMPASCNPVDLFSIKSVDMKRCLDCGHSNGGTKATEHRLHLGMGAAEKDENCKVKPVRCLQQLLTAEVAMEERMDDYKCDNCTGRNTIGTKQFVQFGEYFIIVLKRFASEGKHIRKLQAPVRVPLYLEMAHFTEGAEREEQKVDLNQTIDIDDREKSVKKDKPKKKEQTLAEVKEEEEVETKEVKEEQSKKVDDASPSAKVLKETTTEWLDKELGGCEETNERRDILDQVPADPLLSSTDGEEEEKMEGEEEGGEQPVEEEEQEKQGGGEEKKEKHVIHIDSSQECLTEAGDAAAAVAAEAPPLEELHDDDQTTPPPPAAAKTRGGLRLETPETVKAEERRRSEVEAKAPPQQTTPTTRKRGRAAAAAARKAEREERMSTGSRASLSSLSNSEPPRDGKRSRLDRSREPSQSPAHSTTRTSIHEVTIIDSDDEDVDGEEQRRRRSSLEKKAPVWSTTKSEKKKEAKEQKTTEAVDPFAFDDEDAPPVGERPLAPKKTGRGKFTAPVKKQPLLAALHNGQPQKEKESPSKMHGNGRKQKAENISPNKSAMEQTGGGKRKHDESDEEAEKKKEETEDEMEVDEGKETEGGGRLGNFVTTRRSRVRPGRRTTEDARGAKEEEERSHHDAFLPNGDEAEEAKEPKEEEEMEAFGSQEGGFVKMKAEEEEESSADEIVQSTPPEELEQREAKVEEEESEEKAPAEGKAKVKKEEEEEEEETEVVRVKTEKSEESLATSSSTLQDEAAVFDTPAKHDQGDLSPAELEAARLLTELVNGQAGVKKEEEDGLEDLISGNDEDEEMDEEEERRKRKEQRERRKQKEQRALAEQQKLVQAAWRNKHRAEWRRAFEDKDPPPPRDHMAFRPVDYRWMEAQCALTGFNCALNDRDQDVALKKQFERLTALSLICKVTDCPKLEHTHIIEGDGNCLFRSLCWWVTGSEEEHERMRRKVVSFMTLFPDEFGARMTGPAGQRYEKANEECANRMFNDGEWGTQCEIYGAATLFGVDIYTFHEGRWKQYRPLFEWETIAGSSNKAKVTRKTEAGERTHYGIYLENDDNLHYNIVMYMEPVAQVSSTCYRLLGTILHRGSSISSGHYIADVYDQAKEQWLHCDDSVITERSVHKVLEDAMNLGYVLLYGRNESLVKSQKPY